MDKKPPLCSYPQSVFTMTGQITPPLKKIRDCHCLRMGVAGQAHKIHRLSSIYWLLYDILRQSLRQLLLGWALNPSFGGCAQ